MKGHKESTGRATTIFHLGTRGRWVVSSAPWLL